MQEKQVRGLALVEVDFFDDTIQLRLALKKIFVLFLVWFIYSKNIPIWHVGF
ncbi:MAG: hypothetical protein HOO93_16245 [Methyloglobulus sp.]|nr:hypothetical protein [Methyloglobulus sp.]